MTPSIVSHRQRIDNLFTKAASITDKAEQAEWAKYLCVLVSGYIEESLRVLLEQYTRPRATPVIQNFVWGEIKDVTNCKISKIASVLQRFNPTWETNFLNEIQARSRIADEIKNSVDSVIVNRHQIAHGKNIGLRYATISTYYSNVKRAVEALDAVIQ